MNAPVAATGVLAPVSSSVDVAPAEAPRTTRFTPAEVAAHASELLRVQHAAFRVEAEILGHDDIPYLRETEEDIVDPALVWFVDLGGAGEVRGAIALTDTAAGAAARGRSVRSRAPWLITRVMVDPAFHRRGVAGRLLEQVQAKGEGLVVVTSEENPPGIRMYRKHGFTRGADLPADSGIGPLVEYEWRP
ncbi:GNAT family N-acetyltransferase [Brevibacterium samyangense]|uniref:N-acetyltransferase domain-containing protein n=1 Tax=Brevibacterium samyangense TaxID=366888 RepID=A0ABN2TFN6_9MICO